jgi:hypothetical protein
MVLPFLLFAAAAGEQPAAAPASYDGDKVVCKRIDQTGSRLGSKRICMTRNEWAEKERSDQQELKRMQANSGRCPGGSC